MHLSRRHTIAGALALGLARAARAQDRVKLTYAGWLNLYGAYVPMVKELEASFERRHPGVDWVRNDVPFNEALEQATTATLAGTAADNLHLIAGWVPALHEMGGLEPLNDWFTAAEWAQIPKASLEAVTFEGRSWPCPGSRRRS